MNAYDEIIGMITKVVLDVVRYNVPRLGIVSKIIDDLGKARILVLIPSLGWNTDDTGAWCNVIEKNGIITPNVGDYVIIQFIDGDRDFPVYMGKAMQMKDMLPDSYVDENTQILFESRGREFSIRYEEENGVVKVGEGNESFLKGDTFDVWLSNFISTIYNLHTHAAHGAPPIPTATAPTNYLSGTIKGE